MISGLVGAVNGISVFDWSNPEVREHIRKFAGLSDDFDLHYGQMVVAPRTHGIIVGEQAHFVWRMQQVRLNDECRRRAAEHAGRTFYRIFGHPRPEAWPKLS